MDILFFYIFLNQVPVNMTQRPHQHHPRAWSLKNCRSRLCVRDHARIVNFHPRYQVFCGVPVFDWSEFFILCCLFKFQSFTNSQSTRSNWKNGQVFQQRLVALPPGQTRKFKKKTGVVALNIASSNLLVRNFLYFLLNSGRKNKFIKQLISASGKSYLTNKCSISFFTVIFCFRNNY